MDTWCNFISKYHKQAGRDGVGARCFLGVKDMQGSEHPGKLMRSFVRVWLSVTGAARMLGRDPIRRGQ